MAVPAIIRMGEILNGAQSSVRTETVSRAHRIQSGDHYASDCKTNGPKFAYAPKVIRMNYLQNASDNENDYSEGEQNNSVGND